MKKQLRVNPLSEAFHKLAIAKHMSRFVMILLSITLSLSLLISNGLNTAIVNAVTLSSEITASVEIISDGTPILDAATFVPPSTNIGQDAGLNNGVVRTNDTVVYGLHIAVNKTEATNIIISGVAPAQMAWAKLPDICINNNAPNAIQSSISSDQQSFSCNLGNFNGGTNKLIEFASIVRPTAANGSSASTVFSVSSDTTSQINIVSPSTLITATAKIDVEVDKITESGIVSDLASALGNYATFVVYLKIPQGGEIMNTGNYVVNLNVTNNRATNGYKLYDWAGVSKPACGQLNPSTSESFIYGKLGVNSNSNIFNSVKDSGTITCSQVSPGGNITLNINNPDSSLVNIPIKYASELGVIPGSSYFAAAEVRMWFPNVDVPAVPANSIGITVTQNLISSPASIGGTTPSDLNVTNNTKFHSYSLEPALPPGSGGTGGSYITADTSPTSNSALIGDTFDSYLYQDFTMATTWAPGQVIQCNKVDSSMAHFVSNPKPYGDSYVQHAASPIPDPYIFTSNPDVNFTGSEVNSYSTYGAPNYYYKNQNDITVEYSTSPNNIPNIRDATCDNADGPWSTTPPTDESTITKTRITFNFPDTYTSSEWSSLGAHRGRRKIENYIKVKIKPTTAVNSRVGIFTSYITAYPDGSTAAWSHPQTTDLDPSQPNYATSNSGPYTGPNYAIDNFQTSSAFVTAASAIVKSKVTDIDPNRKLYKNGEQVTFVLEPLLGTKVASINPTNPITVIATLDPGLRYTGVERIVSGSSQGMTKVITGDSLAGTVITYTFPNAPSDGLNMPKIELDTIYENGQYWWPSVKMETQSSLDTVSDIFSRQSSSYAQPTSIEGINISKDAQYTGQRAFYSFIDPASPAPTMVEYLNYTNGGTNNITKEDFINILPQPNNTTIDPESHYSGTVVFKDFQGLTPGSDTFLVTKKSAAQINEDPCHISNIPIGQTASPSSPFQSCKYLIDSSGNRSTTATGIGSITGADPLASGTSWCVVSGDPSLPASFVGLGTNFNCPTNPGEVTAVRVISNKILALYDQTATFTLSFTPTTPLTNLDVYSSHFTARILENNELVRSNDVAHEVRKAQTSGYAYYDLNNNFMQDPNEGGIPNSNVDITGTGYGPDSVLGGGDDVIVNTSTTSDNTGYYNFPGLYPGAYTINVAPEVPKNVSPISDIDGVATPNTGNLTLLTGQNSLNNNFGYDGTNDLSGFVFEDFNKNNIKDANEQYITGAKVEVLDEAHSGSLVAYQYTADQTAVDSQTVYGAGLDGNLGAQGQVNTQGTGVPVGASAISLGQYFFNDLPTGSFTLRLTTPSGYVFLSSIVGSSGGNQNNNNLTGVVLGSNQSLTNYNFTLINQNNTSAINQITNAITGSLAETGSTLIICTLFVGSIISLSAYKTIKKKRFGVGGRE